MIDSSSLGTLSGKNVTGPNGDTIGRSPTCTSRPTAGGGTFATVHTGLFGGGASFFPLDAATLQGDTVTVPFTQEFIKDAPRVENDEELTAPEEERLFQYYSGAVPREHRQHPRHRRPRHLRPDDRLRDDPLRGDAARRHRARRDGRAGCASTS
jgi:hypothetical protein